MADKLTIESARLELRRMFRDEQIIVSVRDCGNEAITPRGTTLEYGIQVGVNGEEFDADTLSEAMAQVRQWWSEQKESHVRR